MSGALQAEPGPCPDEAVIAAFVQGELSAEPAEQLEVHLDACEACGLVVAELARIFDDVVPEGEFSEDPLGADELAETLGPDEGEPVLGRVTLAAGAAVGRYRLLDCVGIGGMGVVYAAYDPELDRRVALKLLRNSHGEGESQGDGARLLREAQALARLTHPNVITVHDVGTWEGQVFVAMEYVDGGTLKTWLRARRREWSEIREVFVAAGRGLAAAHAADLVHRDFKPDNVLIGEDGRVRVTDFGLARWGEGTGSFADRVASDEHLAGRLRDAEPLVARDAEVVLTRTGMLVGTPAYMAPEQYEHQPADATSDQFAFCVALYEAIYGERPFSGKTLAELASNVIDGRMISSAAGAGVPRAVRQAVRRGLSRTRRDRFGSMDELLAVLDQRPGQRWRWLVLAALPLSTLGVGLWAWSDSGAPRSAFCGDESGLAQVWSEDRRARVEQAFVDTALPYASDAAERTLAAVDEYTASWERVRRSTCDPKLGARDGPAVAALRERCLDRRRVSLQAVIEAFEQPDAGVVSRAVGAVRGLPSADECSDREALVAELPPSPPPELRDQVEALRDRIARFDGLIAAGRYREALADARTLDAEAEALGHDPLRAETQLLLGQLLDRAGESEEAIAAFEEAGLRASTSRHRRILARALIEQVYALGVSLSRFDRAERVALRAEAEIEGNGLGDDARAALRLNQGSVAFSRGRYDDAERYIRDTLALRDRDEEPLLWADAAFNLAAARMSLGKHQEAIEAFGDYVEIFSAELGPMHPEVASGYQNLAVAYEHAQRYPEALEAAQEAERVRRLTLGEEHPHYAMTLNTLGSVLYAMDRPDEGLVYARRAIELMEANGDPLRASVNRIELAQLLSAKGQLGQARAEAERALSASVEKLGPEHPVVSTAHMVLGAIASSRRDLGATRHHTTRAMAVLEHSLDPKDPQFVDMQVMRWTLLAEAGDPQGAEAQLRAQLSEWAGQPPDANSARVWQGLGDVLWSDPARRAEAITQVKEARRTMVESAPPGQERLLSDWLDAHPLPPDPE